MPHYLKLDELGALDVDQLQLRLRSFTGVEQLSRLYTFRLHLDVPIRHVARLTPDRVLGRPIVFSIHESKPIFFSGIVGGFSLGNVLTQDLRACSLQVVPELWKLTQRLNTRRFDRRTIAQIAQAIVADYDFDLQLVDQSSSSASLHPPLDAPAQYDESLLNFLGRHLDAESIYYYFRNRHQLSGGEVTGEQEWVLGDDLSGYTQLLDVQGAPLHLRYRFTSTGQDYRSVTDWLRQYSFRPASWTIQDYDYQKSRDFNMVKRSNPSGGPSADAVASYRRAAGFYDKSYGDSLLANTMHREDVAREYILATGHCPHLFPGGRFMLQGHDAATENGEYIVTSIEHFAFDLADGNEHLSSYHNSFACVPVDQVAINCPAQAAKVPAGAVNFDGLTLPADPEQLRNPHGHDHGHGASHRKVVESLDLTPRGSRSTDPAVRPAEIAFICDTDGDYSESSSHYGTVVTDEGDGYARVLIRFPWEDDDEFQKGRWVRVAQPLAGQNWGGKFLPRVGDEVVVMYIDGQERKPMVVGSVYNNVHSLEHQAPSNIWQLETEERNPYNSSDPSLDSAARAETQRLPILDSTRGPTSKPSNHSIPSLSDPNVSGFRTRTNQKESDDGQTPGYNELLFNDTPDRQQIFIHAERDLSIKVKNDLHIEVGGNKSEIIRGDYYRVANVGPAENATHQYPNASDGGVIRAITDGDNYDYDKTWQVWTVRPYASGSPTSTLGSSHGQTSGSATYYLVTTETYADTDDITVGDVRETFHGHFEEHFHGKKLEVVSGSVADSPATIRTEITGFTSEMFDGKTETEFKGESVKTTFTGIGVSEYYIGSNLFSLHVGAKEEYMIGLTHSFHLAQAFELYLGSKLEILLGNLMSLHKGAKIEISPENTDVAASKLNHAVSFGVTAVVARLTGATIQLN